MKVACVYIVMTNITMRKDAKYELWLVDANGTPQCNIVKTFVGGRRYWYIEALGGNPCMTMLNFKTLKEAKTFVRTWLESGDHKLAIHRHLVPLPEYAGR